MYLTYIHAGERPAMGETETEKGPVDLSPGERGSPGMANPGLSERSGTRSEERPGWGPTKQTQYRQGWLAGNYGEHHGTHTHSHFPAI